MPKRPTTRKLTPPAGRVKPDLQTRIARKTGRLVAGMVRELSAIRVMKSLENNAHYVAFRELKRQVYRLYPDQPDKAKSICNFALVRSGWATRV